LRFTISSNRAGRCIGISPGCTPCRILIIVPTALFISSCGGGPYESRGCTSNPNRPGKVSYRGQILRHGKLHNAWPHTIGKAARKKQRVRFLSSNFSQCARYCIAVCCFDDMDLQSERLLRLPQFGVARLDFFFGKCRRYVGPKDAYASYGGLRLAKQLQ
jgi:hypothetical protein